MVEDGAQRQKKDTVLVWTSSVERWSRNTVRGSLAGMKEDQVTATEAANGPYLQHHSSHCIAGSNQTVVDFRTSDVRRSATSRQGSVDLSPCKRPTCPQARRRWEKELIAASCSRESTDEVRSLKKTLKILLFHSGTRTWDQRWWNQLRDLASFDLPEIGGSAMYSSACHSRWRQMASVSIRSRHRLHNGESSIAACVWSAWEGGRVHARRWCSVASVKWRRVQWEPFHLQSEIKDAFNHRLAFSRLCTCGISKISGIWSVSGILADSISHFWSWSIEWILDRPDWLLDLAECLPSLKANHLGCHLAAGAMSRHFTATWFTTR